MTRREHLDRRIAELAEEWDEQSRVLYWVLRDLGRQAGPFADSPFRTWVPASHAAQASKRPAGALGV